MQTILGSGGAIGTPLAKELRHFTDKIRLVSRNPKKVNDTDELFSADITEAAQVDKAISGSDVVYLTAGFAYDIKVWRRVWPNLIRNVIDSCKKYKARLVFFDNIYALDGSLMNNLTEDSPIGPVSKKGQVRAEIHRMIMDEINGGRLQAIIARSADFYGIKNSVLVEMVYKNLLKNKKAMWFADATKAHTFTAAADAARAVALLGNTTDAYNQIWHLPTDRTPLTGKQWVELFAKLMNKEPRLFVIPNWLLTLMGIFIPVFREFKEMVYQYDRDYIFNSSKFEKKFNYVPLSPENGIAQLILELKATNKP
jgi:nucleoside-diphosphate-sugar epimerase